MLRKDKAARPATAQEVAARLDAIPLERPWDQDRARQWWDRHRPERPSSDWAAPYEEGVATSLVQPLREEGGE